MTDNAAASTNKDIVPSTVLVIGAGGGIGQALYHRWADDSDIEQVIGISHLQYPVKPDSDRMRWMQSDYSEASIAEICAELEQQDASYDHVCICNGILHNADVWPDKRIEDLSQDSLLELFRINTVVPMLWLKYLLNVVKGRHACKISVFSARIGSINDNRLGGWYGYRGSKAALNMMLKTASIEYARRAKNVKLIAFHPGTNDTSLSRPFLKNVKHEILQPDETASCLINIMKQAEADGALSFVDWQNQPIEW